MAVGTAVGLIVGIGVGIGVAVGRTVGAGVGVTIPVGRGVGLMAGIAYAIGLTPMFAGVSQSIVAKGDAGADCQVKPADTAEVVFAIANSLVTT